MSVRLAILLRQLKLFDAAIWLAFGLIVIYGLYCAASARPVHDTGLYHAQAVRWIETYRVVPGLANLHYRLGFDSSIFGLAALWGFARFGWHTYQVPGLVIFVSAMLYFLLVLTKSMDTDSIRLSAILAVGTPLFLLLRSDFLRRLSSPATDLPSDLVIWVAFCLAVEAVESTRPEAMEARVLAIMWLALFAVAIKFSAIPVLLLPLLLLAKFRRVLRPKSLTMGASLAGLVFIPWVARKVVLTGYPLFPFPWPDLLQVDWKVPAFRLIEIVRLVRAAAILPRQDVDTVLALKIGDWLGAWYAGQIPSDIVLLNAVIFGAIAVALYVLLHRSRTSAIGPYAPFYALALIGVLFWFSQAPAPRFGYGFLVPTAMISVYGLLVLASSPPPPLANQTFTVVSRMLLLVAVVTGLLATPLSSWGTSLTSYVKYPVEPTRGVKIGDHFIQKPRGRYQCWYTAFPCSSVIEPGVAMRGPSFQDGFYIRNK